MNKSTSEYSRRVEDLGRAPVTDLPTHVADRDGETKASLLAKAAKRVERTAAARILTIMLCSSAIDCVYKQTKRRK